MTQSRTIPASVQTELERESSPDALIWFMTITHASLADAIRAVSDVFDYILDGETYTGFPFEAVAVTDTDQAPSAELRVPNIDRRVGKALEQARGRARVQAVAYSTADFDLTKEPREATGTPSAVYSFQEFELSDVEVNAMQLTGRISLVDYSQEPWPWIRATQDRFPGLYT